MSAEMLNPRDERALMGRAAGVLWLVGALAAGAGALLPDSPAVRPWLLAALVTLIAVYAIGCITGVLAWARVSMRGHALTTALLLPLIGLAIWATGGGQSYIYPLMLFPLLHIAYFFPPRMSVPLVIELVAVYSAPLVYGHIPPSGGAPGRVLAFAAAAAVLTVAVRSLKLRLLAAERRQREMAHSDELTGLANRRGFERDLAIALGDSGDTERGRRVADELPGTILALMDLDGFKLVNDTRGHSAGDDLLRAVAAECALVVRPGDTLARIGGDEFAVVAPMAGQNGAERIVGALADAVTRAGASATIAWAMYPADGTTGDALLRAADRRLYEGKTGGSDGGADARAGAIVGP